VRVGSYGLWIGGCRLKPARRQMGRWVRTVNQGGDEDSASGSGWETGAELERLQRGEI
jgi:hypothetical protein